MQDRTKKCSKCGIEMPATKDFFSINRHHKDGLKSACKTCKNAQYRKYQKTEKGRKTHLKRQKKYSKTEKGKMVHDHYESKIRLSIGLGEYNCSEEQHKKIVK